MVQVLSRHKYKLLIFSLPLTASIISVLLARARIAYSNNNDRLKPAASHTASDAVDKAGYFVRH
jgi:hypothetical protein